MKAGENMHMNWQTMMHEAATVSFEANRKALAEKYGNADCCVELEPAKIKELSEKILNLPHSGIVLFFGRYYFNLSWKGMEKFFQLKDTKEDFDFYRELLSRSIGLEKKQVISEKAFRKACRKALKKYLSIELKENGKIDVTEKNQSVIILRKMVRAVASVAIMMTLLFSTSMVVNAEFREKVVTWMMETFDKFSVFQLNSHENGSSNDLTRYCISYVPQGATLQNTVVQSKMIAYEYTMDDADDITVLVSKDDTRVYIGIENAEMQPLELDSASGYFFAENDMNYICFEWDGNFFAVCSSLDVDELIKIANGITYK